MSPFVVSLGMLSVARGLTYIYTDGMPVPKLEESFLYIGQGRIAGIPLPVLIFAVIFMISWLILYKTRFGRYVYAVGGNEKSARISGVNTRLVVFVVYVISGFLSALGGLTLSARTSAGLPQAAWRKNLTPLRLSSLANKSLWRTGSLVGTLFGALIMASLITA
jgi:putative xylitol transport system permease protein